jgi:hypothetical protein
MEVYGRREIPIDDRDQGSENGRTEGMCRKRYKMMAT